MKTVMLVFKKTMESKCTCCEFRGKKDFENRLTETIESL